MPEKVTKSDEDWRRELSPERYHVLREKGTERPWSGELNAVKEQGRFLCGACGAELFSSAAKFESGTGWPSFFEPASAEAVDTEEDNSWLMQRTEVVCSTCGSHLGHVFPDGPHPTGRRYCINSLALDFEPEHQSS